MVSSKFKRSLVINSVLLVTDLGAGLVLYNYGKSKGSKVSFSLPPSDEFWKMAGVAMATSILTGAAITKVEDRLKVEIFDDTDQAFLDPSEWDSLFTAFKGWKIGQGNSSLLPESIDKMLRGGGFDKASKLGKKKVKQGDN
jgi:hypothetical protein